MWIPTERTELMHSAKGTRWPNHKYTDIVNGRYIYPKTGMAELRQLYNLLNNANKRGTFDTFKNWSGNVNTSNTTNTNTKTAMPKTVNAKAPVTQKPKKTKATNQPKRKKTTDKIRPNINSHGGSSGDTRSHSGSSGDVNLKSSVRNKGHKQYEADKKKLAADAVARAEKNKRRYENAKINAARAAGEKQRREANEKAVKLKKLKQQKVKYARDKGRKQVAALHKPTLIDHARNFLHEGSIKYNRFVRGLSEAFNGGSKKKSKKRKK